MVTRSKHHEGSRKGFATQFFVASNLLYNSLNTLTGQLDECTTHWVTSM